MKAIAILLRAIFGGVFIFSGFVKAVDPWGTAYKIEEYIAVFGMNWITDSMPWISIVVSILMSSIEFIIGVLIFFGFFSKLSKYSAAIIMGFFTILTFIDALTNKVDDCGCFGDAIKLTNWETFWKNFSNLCLQKGKTPNAVGAELGCSSTSINSWKKGSIPKWGVLYKMAEYFGVSIKTLLNSAEMDDLPNEPPQKLIDLNSGDVRMIPLFESVSAGFGALAFDDIVDYVPLYIPNQAEADDTICIKVKGNSMSPRIEDGDIVQVRKTQSIDNGSIAVVTVDDEGLLKRVTYGEKWMELRSINPMYKPMRFNSEDLQRVRVVGVVVKIIKHVGGREEIIETIPTDYNEGEQALLELFRSVPEDKRELLMQVIKLTLNKG